MRTLIEAVKAEAEQTIADTKAQVRYHQEQVADYERIQERAQDRIKACDDALAAIDAAAKSLTGQQT